MKKQYIFLSHDVDWSYEGPSKNHILERKDRFDSEIFANTKPENLYRNIPKYMELEERFGIRSTFFFRTVYENGNLMISGTWSNGYETEDIHEYNEDGTPNTKRFDPGPSIIKEDSLESIENNAIDSIVVKANKKLTPPKIIPTFDGNGFHEFKDRYGNNSKVGEFENGLLVNGKIFKYNQKGKLIQTKHVKNGKIVLVENNKEVEE